MPVGRGPATYPLRCVSVIMSVGDVAQSAPFSSPQLSDPDMIDSLRRSIMRELTIQTCAFRRCHDHTRKFRHAQLALRLRFRKKWWLLGGLRSSIWYCIA